MPGVVAAKNRGPFLLMFVAALQSPVVRGLVVLLSGLLISAAPHCDSRLLSLR